MQNGPIRSLSLPIPDVLNRGPQFRRRFFVVVFFLAIFLQVKGEKLEGFFAVDESEGSMYYLVFDRKFVPFYDSQA